MRVSVRPRFGALVAAAAAAFLISGAVVSPALAGGDRSPGCAAWDALGDSGWTSAVTTIPGPFFEGETVRLTKDLTPGTNNLNLLTTGDEIVDYGGSKGASAFRLTKDLAEITFDAGPIPPASWFLSNFSCTPVGGEDGLSPGCVTWNYFGAGGGTTMDAGAYVRGPFFAGETLVFTLSRDRKVGSFYISAVEGDPPHRTTLHTSTVGGRKLFVLPRDVDTLAFAAGYEEIPFILDYTDMTCYAAGQQPPTDTLGAAPPSRQDDPRLIGLLVFVAGMLLLASRGTRAARVDRS
jgi:hypothetical protein